MWNGKYTFEKSRIIFGDCIDKMNLIPDNCIDLICCDLPYGVTANDLDKMIPPSLLWKHYWRIAKSPSCLRRQFQNNCPVSQSSIICVLCQRHIKYVSVRT